MLPVYRTPLHVFNYDDIPPGYYYEAMRSGSSVQRFWHRQKFKEVALAIPDCSSVLDLGCGPGSFLAILGELLPGVRATGVDIASSQIDFAVREVVPRFGGRIQFRALRPDSPRLPFDGASFDFVTSIEVLEHIHPHLALKMLEEAVRVLKPEGRILVTTPNYRSFWPIIETMLERLSPVKYHAQHINRFTPNSLVKFLETVGLEVIRLRTIFIVAPFLAPLGDRTVQALHALERKAGLMLGSLLLAECGKNRVFG